MNVPHSSDAERAVLGAMLLDRGIRELALGALSATAFYEPAHEAIFAGIVSLHGRGQPVDPVTLSSELGARGTPVARRELDAFVAESSSVSAPGHVRIVADLAARRRLMAVASGLMDSAEDLTVETAETVAWLEAQPETVRLPEDRFEPPTEASDLAAEPSAYDWAVDRLYERGDRIIWTAGEGAGKSEMQLQQAVCLAAGIHPFTFVPIPRLRVLLVDLENSRRQLRRRIDSLLRLATDRYKGGLGVVNRMEGLDLRDPRDFRWLDRLCEHHRAEVLVMGPLYKTFRVTRGEKITDETAAGEAAFALDKLRARHNLVVSLEAHSPHGHQNDRDGLRPYGAALWMRWPEFGIGIQRDKSDPLHAKLVFWRGWRDRDREMPHELFEGARGSWPWIAPSEQRTAA